VPRSSMPTLAPTGTACGTRRVNDPLAAERQEAMPDKKGRWLSALAIASLCVVAALAVGYVGQLAVTLWTNWPGRPTLARAARPFT
jgi:hypothetical protein